MGIWTLTGEVDGGPLERAILIDSVTERPLALPAFDCRDDADAFVAWLSAESGSDPRALSAAVLDAWHTRWISQRCGECYTLTCACVGCARPCTQACPRTCGEARGRELETERQIDEVRS